MKADSYDTFQHGGRRLNEGVTLLLRPSGTRGAVNLLGHWDAQILVKGDKPIALDSLCE
jgi:hypothetical protein